MSRAEAVMDMMSKARPYPAQKIPSALREENIGAIVKVQVFMRNSIETIDTDSLEKYVGRMLSYSFDPTTIHIKIEGLDIISVPRHRKYVEVIL
jgi:hypothetical protein